MNVEGAKVLVVGMKRSGMAAARLLKEQRAIIRATDLQTLEALPEAQELLQELKIPFERQSDAVFEDADVIVISPDVPSDLPALNAARERGADVIGDLELAAPLLRGQTIGVTGSNGKTTTTSLIGHILGYAGIPAQVGGNIGLPVSAMVEESARGQWNVLELSSFQLETVKTFRANIGVALNVTQNHLDRHHTFENYAMAKGKLFETQRSGDMAVLNADDEICAGYGSRGRGTVRWFSTKKRLAPGACLSGDELLLDGRPLLNIHDIPIRGLHNVQNVMAASIAAARAGASREDIGAAIRTFRAVEHRLEFVRSLNGIDFYNDSKATSVDATLKALDAFPGGLWVILGGKDKGLNYRLLREPLEQKAHAALLIGAAATKIGAQLQGAVPLVEAKTLEAAVQYAWERAHSGDTILLAPACASFDQFKSFEERGEIFKNFVMGLAPRS